MKIRIFKIAGHRYRGTLDLGDGEVYTTTLEHHRPGCAVRELFNLLVVKYGEPSEVTIDMEWE